MTREQARLRREPVDRLLNEAAASHGLANGIEYRFVSTPDLWPRLEAFIEEESDCCPFLAFEIAEEGGETTLRLFQPEEESAR